MLRQWKMKSWTVTQMFISLAITDILLSSACSEKLVVDTDGGADDAAAILLLLSAWEKHQSDFEVEAITCVNGNTMERTVEENVLKIITIANASQIQVYGGAHKPLVGNSTTDHYYGNDGLGDFTFEKNVTAKVDKFTYASVALINLAKKYPCKLNILCLGPLTNIAIAASLDPEFMLNVKRFYIMGGSVAGVGNKRPGVEFNFEMDPTSNFIVLNYTRKVPSLLYPWEAVLDAKIPINWRINKLGSIDSATINFLNKAESKSLKTVSPIWTPSDLLATAVMIWPNLVKRSLITNVTPIIYGEAMGAVLVDYENNSGKPKNVEIVQQIDVVKFQRKLLYHFS